ncbi:TPR repeat-containing serine/threonine protein kinase [Candidatus Magnetobacterium bavaricum]|uniref:TPR repeat-containing serine/threonine protein kinase n=1 Tax=Candidatus Magnetobacterium bavaricum TaxID=29290 RepID=A0A0F3GYN6_9BACT|nr:TPR repeat-containing serine/threonine protein kinase [Candidatus Magnetobacterium bavaricum]
MAKLQTICPGCFRDRGNDGVICSSCGYDESQATSAIALPLKTLLNNNKYISGKLLGKPGGFGITYLGYDINLRMRIAIKEYFPKSMVSRIPNSKEVAAHSLEDEESLQYGIQQFLQEARVLAKFVHQNVVRVKDFFEESNTAYIVMDYYDGISLEEYRIKKGGKLTEQESLDIMMAVLSGLMEVHGKGFLHRDIKPHNIFITTDNRPILLDFGAARQAISEKSRGLTVVLTEGFAPYEQYQSRGNQGPWTDIYAVGATFYYILSGVLPTDAASRKSNVKLVPLRQLVPSISPYLDNIIAKAMAVEPTMRPQTVEDLLKLFETGNRRVTEIHTESRQQQQNRPEPDSRPIPPSNRRDSSPGAESSSKKAVLSFALVMMALILVSIGLYGYKLKDDKKKIKEYLAEGHEKLKDEQYDSAIVYYSNVIEITPGHSDAYNGRGDAYRKKGDYDRAIDDYTKAIEIAPRYADAYSGRGIAYHKKGYYDSAITDYTRAIEIDPRDDVAYSNRGIAYINKGDYNSAIADCTKAIDIDPQYDSAYANRGIAYANKGDYDNAIADYTKALEINPKHTYAYTRLENAYKNKQERFRSKESSVTNTADAYYNSGVSYYNKKQYSIAIIDYTKAIELNPRYIAAYLNRGTTYYKIKDYDHAVADFSKVIEMNSIHVTAYHNRAFAYIKSGNLHNGCLDMKKACDLKSSDSCNTYRELLHSAKCT